MNNKQFMYIIKTYQENDYVHPLTCICGAGAMDCYEKNDKVLMYCKDCGYEQELDGFLASMIVEMYLYSPFNPGLKR
jgi:hypothetical protein